MRPVVEVEDKGCGAAKTGVTARSYTQARTGKPQNIKWIHTGERV
jgi:hypothetical protein